MNGWMDRWKGDRKAERKEAGRREEGGRLAYSVLLVHVHVIITICAFSQHKLSLLKQLLRHLLYVQNLQDKSPAALVCAGTTF